MGLSPLCPIPCGFHLERFLDLDGSGSGELSIGGLVSMTGVELLRFLWKRDFVTRVFQYETRVNGRNRKMEDIGAKQRGGHGEGPRIILGIATPSNLAIGNLLSPEQLTSCVDDSATWAFLEMGDTDGIDNLESNDAREMLRERRPKSLGELAEIMFNQSSGRGSASGRAPDYQEDLMSLLFRSAGVPLREAYMYIRSAALNKPEQLKRAREKILERARQQGIQVDSAISAWNHVQDKSRVALCKAHVFTVAHLALQAGYVRAHHPDKFRAIMAALN